MGKLDTKLEADALSEERGVGPYKEFCEFACFGQPRIRQQKSTVQSMGTRQTCSSSRSLFQAKPSQGLWGSIRKRSKDLAGSCRWRHKGLGGSYHGYIAT